MNDSFSHKGSVNRCMQLNAHKKCPPLETDLEPSSLAQWLGDNTGLTTQLVEEVVEPYIAWHAKHLSAGTTWNEAAKWAFQKRKPRAITTSKTVAPHPEQIPSLLQWVTENKSLDQNDANRWTRSPSDWFQHTSDNYIRQYGGIAVWRQNRIVHLIKSRF